MKLNGAIIENMSIGNLSFSDSSDFVKALKACRNLLADVYLDSHKVAVAGVTFHENNGWLIADLNCRFALSEPVLVNCLLVKIHKADSDVITMSTCTNVSEYIEVGDQEAELHFNVISVTPYNSRKKVVPASRLRWLQSFLIAASKLSDLPTDQSVVIDDQDPDEPATYGNTDLSGIGPSLLC